MCILFLAINQHPSYSEKQLEVLVKSSAIIEPNELFEILGDQSCPNYTQLPKTGISEQWELLLSSIFICSAEYGTRSSSVIIRKSDDSVLFVEAVYSSIGIEEKRKQFNF